MRGGVSIAVIEVEDIVQRQDPWVLVQQMYEKSSQLTSLDTVSSIQSPGTCQLSTGSLPPGTGSSDSTPPPQTVVEAAVLQPVLFLDNHSSSAAGGDGPISMVLPSLCLAPEQDSGVVNESARSCPL